MQRAIDYYKTIKRYYDRGIYDKTDVYDFVTYKKITEEQYEEIVGEPFPKEVTKKKKK